MKAICPESAFPTWRNFNFVCFHLLFMRSVERGRFIRLKTGLRTIVGIYMERRKSVQRERESIE